ncbi:MAG: hypothetical protein HGA97_03030 [Chlorobiaceae bacterium]|nr:hypothetical protein [Chlorobiaceae bacterium]
MAEYGEWNLRGATLSDVTAKTEYGVSREFVVNAIRAGKIECREGSQWGNPYLRILRRQLEQCFVEEFGEEYLMRLRNQAELGKVKKEISSLKKKLGELQNRKTVLEELLKA